MIISGGELSKLESKCGISALGLGLVRPYLVAVHDSLWLASTYSASGKGLFDEQSCNSSNYRLRRFKSECLWDNRQRQREGSASGSRASRSGTHNQVGTVPCMRKGRLALPHQTQFGPARRHSYSAAVQLVAARVGKLLVWAHRGVRE